MSGTMHPVTSNVIRNARAYRQARKLSVQKVADEMTARGVRIQRSVLANFEGWRRPTISIAELVTLADVLGVTINDLIDDAGPCATCYGTPPAGFACITCGAGSALSTE
jgi:transcriptional regulator with XRE-family HTH domain